MREIGERYERDAREGCQRDVRENVREVCERCERERERDRDYVREMWETMIRRMMKSIEPPQPPYHRKGGLIGHKYCFC